MNCQYQVAVSFYNNESKALYVRNKHTQCPDNCIMICNFVIGDYPFILSLIFPHACVSNRQLWRIVSYISLNLDIGMV